MDDTEVYITCPYNKCHRIRKSRFQIHITKCAKNYPKDYKVYCKYDRSHLLDPDEYEHHLLVCPTSGDVKSKEITLESDEDAPTVPVENLASSTRTCTMAEDWSGNSQPYNPLAATENRDVIRGAIAMSKSRKKEFKQHERERMCSLQKAGSDDSSNASNNASTTRKKLDIEQPLQPPKQLSKAMLCDGNFASNLISKLGKLKIEESKGTTSGSSKREDVSIACNNSNKIADSEGDCLENNTIDTSIDIGITSSTRNNSFSQKEKEKENIPNEENNAAALFKNTSEVEDKHVSDIESDSKTNVISQGNNYETQGNDRNDNIKKNNSQSKSSKQGNCSSQNIISCNTKIAAKLYGEAKKISTGRGFTRIYQHLNSNMKMGEEGEGEKMTQDLVSNYGYDKE